MLVPWTYKDSIINKVEDVFKIRPDLAKVCCNNTYGLYGFVYLVTFPSLKCYVGKKAFYSLSSLKPRLSKLPRPGHICFFKKRIGHRYKERERIVKETGWLLYHGSAEYCKSHLPIKKEILEFATSKRYLTYLEVKYQCVYNVLEDEMFINDNILGRFYRNNLQSTCNFVDDLEEDDE